MIKAFKKKTFLAFLAVLLGSSAAFSYAKEEPLGYESRILIKKQVLDNGLTVLVSEVPGSPMVSVYALVKAGSATEGKFLGCGLSHFLEHMLFKGTETRDAGDIAAEIQSLGGVLNASTSFDYTIYTITVPQGHLLQALDVLSDMLQHAKFDRKQVEREREVVYGEMRMREDNPSSYHSQLIFRNVFLNHPYRLPIIGYEDLLRKLDREDFLEYYHRHYIPNNTVLSIAGGIKAEEGFAQAKKVFKDWERKVFVLRKLPQEYEQISQRRYTEEYPTQTTRIALSYQGVSLLDKDMFALDVLAMILGRGESSRLYLELFKKLGVVESISAYDFTPIDKGFFGVDCIPRGSDNELVIGKIIEQIENIKKNGVTLDELNKAKRQILSNYFFEKQTSSDIAYQTATDEAFTGDSNFSRKYVSTIKNVTNDDIKKVAQKYLNENNLSLTILAPEKDKEVLSHEEDSIEITQTKRVVLGNGLTLLMKENHTFPLVSVNLALNGGTRVEGRDDNGISNLTANVWIKGTKTKTAEQIAKEVESLGMSLSCFSGRNSFGINFNFLSENIEFGLDLLEDLVVHPTFDAKELQQEKEKVKTQLKLRNDSISYITQKNFRENLFKKHSMRLDALGTFETIENISRKEILEFYKMYVLPGNMVLSVFGDFDTKSIEALLREKFSALKNKKCEIPVQREAPPEKMQEINVTLDKKQAMVLVGFQGLNILDGDRFGMEVLTSLLGSPFNGRIFSNVREDLGKAYSAGGEFVPGMETGYAYFYALISKDSIEEVKNIIFDAISEIQAEFVSETELNDMKSYINGTFQMQIEKNASLGFTSTLDELYGLGHDFYKKHDELINNITVEDIRRLAKKYFNLDRAVVVTTSPGK